MVVVVVVVVERGGGGEEEEERQLQQHKQNKTGLRSSIRCDQVSALQVRRAGLAGVLKMHDRRLPSPCPARTPSVVIG